LRLVDRSIAVVKGYVWRHVKQEGAKVFVRGIRSWEKDGHDERSLQILNTWGPLVLGPLWWPLPTIFLEGQPEYNHVSSTLIREICRTKDEKEALEDVSRLVPRAIAEDVTRFYGAEDYSGKRDAI
jgi:phosphopantetheine adenylyltransferase